MFMSFKFTLVINIYIYILQNEFLFNHIDVYEINIVYLFYSIVYVVLVCYTIVYN